MSVCKRTKTPAGHLPAAQVGRSGLPGACSGAFQAQYQGFAQQAAATVLVNGKRLVECPNRRTA